jgi:hypothetical protein
MPWNERSCGIHAATVARSRVRHEFSAYSPPSGEMAPSSSQSRPAVRRVVFPVRRSIFRTSVL